MLRCKPGQIAMVIGDPCRLNNGVFIRIVCLSWVPGAWIFMDASRPVFGSDGERYTHSFSHAEGVAAMDKYLIPITPPDTEKELPPVMIGAL